MFFAAFFLGLYKCRQCLDLEATRRTTSTSALELASLASDVGLDVAAGGSGVAKVLDGLASVLGAAEENGVGSLGSKQGELVKGQALTASSSDPGTGSVREAEGADPELGGGDETRIVGDSSDKNGDLVLLALHVAHNAGNAHRGPVDARHEQTLQHHAVERAGGTAIQEPVNLDQKGQVNVVRGRPRALVVANKPSSSF